MITVERICIHQGDFQLSDLSFQIEKGEYAILMGKTGSGKTTVLEAICGLRSIHSGRILLNNLDVTQMKPAERGLGYVPQDLALFSTMTVKEHLAFALKIRKANRELIEQRVAEMANLLNISHLLHRKPFGLSGGESQRVALGRALSFHPNVLLLDEPLSALDESTRHEMYDLLRSVQKRVGVTTLHITHSWTEAQALGDRILLLKDGKLQDLSPGEVTRMERYHPGENTDGIPTNGNGEPEGIRKAERKI